jgi:hypothetical protein
MSNVSSRRLFGPILLLVVCAGRLHADPPWVSLPKDFPSKPVIFEQFDTASGVFQGMRYFGYRTLGPNGSLTARGDVYNSPTATHPYVQLDQERNIFYLAPGTFPTKAIGAVVTVGVPETGDYKVEGVFARANDFMFAGDGVRVVAFVNGWIDSPIFSANISSGHLVDPYDPFAGTGTAPFSFTVRLVQADRIQFAVFSGPDLLDGTFDLTALKFSIRRVARP